ncbi:MAG: hypothetical protein RLZZ175_2275 [Bacteroidota bacterium]|jgi:hypothetical protein
MKNNHNSLLLIFKSNIKFIILISLILCFNSYTFSQVTTSTTGYYNNFKNSTVNTPEQTFSALSWGSNGASFSLNASDGLDINLTNLTSWTSLQNSLTNTINITTLPVLTLVIKGTFTNSTAQQYLYVAIEDYTGKSSFNSLQSILPINPTFTPYNIDFNTIGYTTGFDKTKVKSIKFYIVNSANGCCATSGLSGTVSFSAIKLGNIIVTDPTINTGYEWSTLGSNLIYTNKGMVYIGTDVNDEPTLTKSPYYQFTVKGRSNIVGDDNALEIWSADKNGSKDDNYRQYLTFNNGVYTASTNSYASLGSSTWNTGMSQGRSTDLLFQNNGGNVGVGSFTDSPTEKLTVNGNILGLSNINVGAKSNSLIIGNRQKLTFNADENSDELSIIRYNVANNQTELRVIIGDDPTIVTNPDAFSIGSLDYTNSGAWTRAFTVNVNGNAELAKDLRVIGRIATKEVCVNPNSQWCDYVFEKDYKLMPLKELGAYVSKNKHLPEVPTTAEVEQSGVNLGEINVIYLKKIEELTLYMLELQKQIDELKKK